MAALYKLQWSSGCSGANIYYNDGYADFLFFDPDDATCEVLEPIYEVKRDNAEEKDGRTVAPRKFTKKTYKIRVSCRESVADTLSVIALAETVLFVFPDNTAIADLTGDDITFTVVSSAYSEKYKETIFVCEILILADVIIKTACCENGEDFTPYEESTGFPSITSESNSTLSVTLSGQCPTNYFIRSYYKELFAETSWPSGSILGISNYSALGAFAFTDNNKIYITSNGFVGATLKYSAPAQ